MKTSVVITKESIKSYYNDLFFRKHFVLIFTILIISSIGSFIYIANGYKYYAVALTILSIFVSMIIFLRFFKAKNEQLTIIDNNEKIYNIEFSDTEMIVISPESKSNINYKEIRINKLKRYNEFIIKKKETKIIYIIPKKDFNVLEWKRIEKYIKESK